MQNRSMFTITYSGCCDVTLNLQNLAHQQHLGAVIMKRLLVKCILTKVLKIIENFLYRNVDFLLMRNIHLLVHPQLDGVISYLCCGEGVLEIKVK